MYVIVIDAFSPWETEAHTEMISLDELYVMVIVTWHEINSQFGFYVCNVFLDDGTASDKRTH